MADRTQCAQRPPQYPLYTPRERAFFVTNGTVARDGNTMAAVVL